MQTLLQVKEGTYIEPITKVATVVGKVRNILLGERVSLNIITRASGIATLSSRLCDKVYKQNKNGKWHGEIAGTRKTTPGFRCPNKFFEELMGLHNFLALSLVIILIVSLVITTFCNTFKNFISNTNSEKFS